jgi:uncharacterized SAM-dependent methyltransferase
MVEKNKTSPQTPKEKQKTAFKPNGSGINDLIFKELLKRGYSLEGNTRVWNIADSKLWYLTPEQAQGYLDLDEDKQYKSDTGQPQGTDLILSAINDIITTLGGEVSINIVDLGCGNGDKAAYLIKLLKGKFKVRYCPVDISGYMVEKAIEEVSKLNVEEIIEFQYNISDFENLENITPLLRKGDFKRNLILLLGNTLGNFDIHELLYEIRGGMKEGDVFVIDTALDDHKQKERCESYKKNKKVNDWLIHVPLQLGLKEEDVELGVRFRNSRIEAYYTIKDDKTINFQNKTLNFNKGDQIIVVVAYKHDKDAFVGYLKMYFTDVVCKFSKDNYKVLAVCKK